MFWKSWFAERRVPLCEGCAFAHVELGYAEDEERFFCAFGGSVRELPFAVGACSDFRDKSVSGETRVVTGFVPASNVGVAAGVVAKKE